MGMIADKMKTILGKLFVGVHEEEQQDNTDPKVGEDALEAVKLGIFYENNAHKYCRFDDKGQKVREIDPDDYLNFLDIELFKQIVDSSLGQLGCEYAKNLNCDVNDLKLVMSYNDPKKYQCDAQKAAKKEAGIFGSVKECECRICQQAGMPFGELYKGDKKEQDIIFSKLIST